MKQCVLTGGGSKFGALLTNEFIKAGYHVYLITSNGNKWKQNSHVSVVDVSWRNFELSTIKTCIPDIDHIDVVFFNHNASSLSSHSFETNKIQSYKDWQHSYFVACQFPYYFINALSKKLSNTSKVGWMLSGLIKHPIDAEVGFADYIGNKFTNACIMKNFSMHHNSCFFGLYPEDGLNSDPVTKSKRMVDLIDSTDVSKLNGNILDSNNNILNLA